MSLPILGQGNPPASTSTASSSSKEAPTEGPLAVALRELWEQQAPELMSVRGWIKLWRLRRRFALRQVSLSGLKVLVPTGQLPDCENCLDLCCTGPNAVVSLRLRDIATLMDLGRPDLIAWDRPPSTKKDSAARRAADSTVFHRAFPTMARDATGTCKALNEDRLCGLWPNWPLSCARYPYALDTLNGVVFYAKGCRSTRLAEVGELSVAVRDLVRASVDAYNARVRDIILLHVARNELRELGLLTHLREAELGF